MIVVRSDSHRVAGSEFSRNLSPSFWFTCHETMTREGSVLKSPGEEPEERLLIEAAQKDPGRFAELYEKNFDRVYAYIARRVRSRVDVQDLTSHVFHQALANIARFEWRGAPFAAWLYRIASNAILDHVQRKAREAALPYRDASSRRVVSRDAASRDAASR